MTSQTNEKHFANDVVCRPINEKQRHMRAHRHKRNTLEKTSYDASKTNEYFAKRHHMTSNRQTRNTLQTTSHNVLQANEKYFAKRHHMTSNRQTRNTANDVICRLTDKRETLCKRRHMTSHRQKRNTLKTTSCDVIRAGKRSSESGLKQQLYVLQLRRKRPAVLYHWLPQVSLSLSIALRFRPAYRFRPGS